MKNKSFLSKLEELKTKAPDILNVERKLIPRLKFMGYVMFSLTLAAFIFALTIKEESITEQQLLRENTLPEAETALFDDAELELEATEVLNFYVVSLIFATLGASCFLIAWKKKKTLYSPSVVDEK